jgi:hypothetical protein
MIGIVQISEKYHSIRDICKCKLPLVSIGLGDGYYLHGRVLPVFGTARTTLHVVADH